MTYCNHEDAPCCGCGGNDDFGNDIGNDVSEFDGEFERDEPGDMSDVEADADTLASAGYGTDEDYGYFGGDEF